MCTNLLEVGSSGLCLTFQDLSGESIPLPPSHTDTSVFPFCLLVQQHQDNSRSHMSKWFRGYLGFILLERSCGEQDIEAICARLWMMLSFLCLLFPVRSTGSRVGWQELLKQGHLWCSSLACLFANGQSSSCAWGQVCSSEGPVWGGGVASFYTVQAEEIKRALWGRL